DRQDALRSCEIHVPQRHLPARGRLDSAAVDADVVDLVTDGNGLSSADAGRARLRRALFPDRSTPAGHCDRGRQTPARALEASGVVAHDDGRARQCAALRTRVGYGCAYPLRPAGVCDVSRIGYVALAWVVRPGQHEWAMTCLVCGSAAPAPLYRIRDVPVVRCPMCGLGRALIPPGFDPSVIYDQSYFEGGQADGYANYQGSRDVLVAEFRRVLRDLAAAGARDGRLLEIGCAYGFFLDEARTSFQVSGVELAADAVAACRTRGLDVVREADDAFYRSRAPFDVVVMLDVIEHLEAPDQVLRTVHRHTRPGALLVITTGDFGSLAARLLGR